MSDRSLETFLRWLPKPKQRVPGNRWPQVLGPRQAVLKDMILGLQESQWWSADELQARQLEQAELLVRFAAARVPQHQRRFREAGFDPAAPMDWETFQALPILTRDELQAETPQATELPKGHGRARENRTSGSTGKPVRIFATEFYNQFYRAFAVRDHFWAGRDPHWRMAAVRFIKTKKEIGEDGVTGHGWCFGPTWHDELSPSHVFPIGRGVGAQARWLEKVEPQLLVSYPSNMAALATYCREEGIDLPELRQVSCIGEMLTPTQLHQMDAAWNVPVKDLYSSEEIGYIASQCPDGEGYHVHAEGVIAEILDDEGRPCEPGQTGRLVLTGLHNFATPMLRYAIRDYAEAGAPCSCGRGLPVIRRIVGRQRNMLVTPDGDQRWPLTGYQAFTDRFPIRQFQFVQTAPDAVTVRLVADRRLDDAEMDELRGIILGALGYPFALTFEWPEALESGPNGKFEEFISRL